jgi:predicted PurR-regulated permease PerM
MKKRTIVMAVMIAVIMIPSFLFAFETAPRISDREIVERLTRLEEGQKSLERRFDDLRSEMNGRFDDVNSRINDLRSEMNSRFNTLQWMLGLFITIALVMLGFVLRMQWQMHRRQTQMETTLETHKDEIAFLKGLIEKLLSPKGVL